MVVNNAGNGSNLSPYAVDDEALKARSVGQVLYVDLVVTSPCECSLHSVIV